MISRLPGSRCLEVSGCSLRRKAGGRVAHDETRDVDRRRAATGLDRARVRAQRSCLALHSAITWLGALRGWRHARASGMALGMGARDDHARQRSGLGRRIPLRARGASSWGEAEGHEHSPAGILVTRRTAGGSAFMFSSIFGEHVRRWSGWVAARGGARLINLCEESCEPYHSFREKVGRVVSRFKPDHKSCPRARLRL